MTKTVTDVICPFCGTLCDDLEVEVSDDGKTIMDVYNACAIGAEKFMHGQSKGRVTRPRIQQPDGSYKEVTYDEAVEYTAQMFAKSKKPLMYGWSSTICEAQSIGHEIAEKAGAIVDNTATVCHGTTLIAVQDVGIATIPGATNSAYSIGSVQPSHVGDYIVVVCFGSLAVTSSPATLVILAPYGHLVRIPAGTFLLGSPVSEVDRSTNESPQTTVTLSRGFWIGTYEVTQQEFSDVMGTNPSHFTST